MRLILFICFLLKLVSAEAQQNSFYFSNINTENGLSNNKVNCIIQDSRGFIWLGTDDGLNRYDGFRFQQFRHQHDTISISGNIITDLLEDKNGILWIATADGGLSSYDHRLAPEKQFKQFKHLPSDSNSIPGNIINALEQDRMGNLWIATRGHGLLHFNKATGKFKEPKWQKSRTVLSLTIDKTGQIWAGREGGGLIRIDPSDFQLTEDIRYRDVYAKLPHMSVAALYADKLNKIWIGSWDKVIYQLQADSIKENSFTSEKLLESFANDDPLAFAEDQKGIVWIGGHYNGLYRFNPSENSLQHFQHDPSKEGSLADNQVNCVFIDRAGLIWIGCNRGVSIYNPRMQQFEQTFLTEAPPNSIIYDFIHNDSGKLLIGTSDGVYVQESGEPLIKTALVYKQERLAATKFFRGKDGQLYVGTNKTLFKLTGGRLSLLPNTESDRVMGQLIESRVVSVIEDSIDGNNILLVSPYGHFLAFYDLKNERWISRRDTVYQIINRFNIKDNLIRKFYKSSTGEIWLATVKAGLGRWKIKEKLQMSYYYNDPSKSSSIGNNNVYDMIEDGRGGLWVSTFGGGLYRLNLATDEFEHIKSSHNLAEGLQVDRTGNVWLIANGNLHKYDPLRKQYTSFQLPDAEKSGGIKGYIYKNSDGDMYVAGNRYFIRFNPESIIDFNVQPVVLFTDFKVLNKSKSDFLYADFVKLKHNENFFTVDFAAPFYQAGYPVQYAHKLEGFDEDWIDDGTNSTVNYTNLDGGTYTFRVRATVKPGQWGEEIASLRITIVPPFWKTWWFYLLCLAAVALAVLGVYRYRINELLKRQAIRNKIAQDLHDNVGSTLSSISVYSQVAKIYKQTDKQEALQDTLEKISETSGEMISEMNDIVWAINPRNDNMATIVQRMESFARPLLASQELRFHFDYPEQILQMHLEMTKRKNFYLIFKEAINNALKYAQANHIWVRIQLHHKELELEVRDDGIGFDPEGSKRAGSLSGNGLVNIRLRAKEMKGECVIKSQPGAGTIVRLIVAVP